MHRCLAERKLCELTGQDGRQQHQHSAIQIAGLVCVGRAEQRAWTEDHLQLLSLKWKSAVRVHYLTDCSSAWPNAYGRQRGCVQVSYNSSTQPLYFYAPSHVTCLSPWTHSFDWFQRRTLSSVPSAGRTVCVSSQIGSTFLLRSALRTAVWKPCSFR